MKYTVIADSCCDLFSKDLNSPKINFHVVPMTLIIGEDEYVDDESLDTAMFLEKMKASKTCPRTACPSPEAFAEIMRSSDNIIIVTLSAKLSGTHASAMLAAEMIKTESPNKKLFVLDTLTASAGVSQILFKLKDLIECGEHGFDEITVRIGEFAHQTRTRFLLQDLTNLIKNGRMGKVVGTILNTAKIKLICGDNGAGEIKKCGMALSIKKGMQTLAEMSGKDLKIIGADIMAPITIAHSHNEEDASFLKRILESKFGFKNIRILLMRGTATLYAADKGIVIAN